MVPITEESFLKVAEGKDMEATAEFGRRVATSQGLKITDVSHFDDMMRFYSGECGTGTYSALVAELHSAAQPSACGDVWTASDELAKEGGKKVSLIERWAGMQDRLPTWRWQRNVVKPPVSLLSQAVSHQASAAHSKAQSESTSEGQGGAGSSWMGRFSSMLTHESTIGQTAELNEEGYSAVAACESEAEMTTYVRRVAAEQGLKVADEAALAAMMPFYNGECETATFATLVSELHRGTDLPSACGTPWVEEITAA